MRVILDIKKELLEINKLQKVQVSDIRIKWNILERVRERDREGDS